MEVAVRMSLSLLPSIPLTVAISMVRHAPKCFM
jgi:hypothetical protein